MVAVFVAASLYNVTVVGLLDFLVAITNLVANGFTTLVAPGILVG